jgi:hypothetical protein
VPEVDRQVRDSPERPEVDLLALRLVRVAWPWLQARREVLDRNDIGVLAQHVAA